MSQLTGNQLGSQYTSLHNVKCFLVVSAEMWEMLGAAEANKIPLEAKAVQAIINATEVPYR